MEINMAGMTRTPCLVQKLLAFCLLWTTVVVVVVAWPTTVTTTNLAFEAAFQGSCVEKNPCEQTCFDLHDGTFECGCHPRFFLSADGYSCKVGRGSYEDDEDVDEVLPASTTPTPSRSEQEFLAPMIIDGRKSTQLKTMSHVRVDYGDAKGGTSSSSSFSSSSDSSRYTLRKTSTATTTYVTEDETSDDDGGGDGTEDEEEDVENWDDEEEVMDDDDDDEDDTEDRGFEGTFDEQHYASYDDIMMEAKTSSSRESNQINNSDEVVVVVATTSEKDGYAASDDHVDADELRTLCDRFQCEGISVCVSSGVGDSSSGVQCLCPLGRGGLHCEKYVEVRFPKFHGRSYLTLPTPKNSYRDLQLTLEFRPETPHGLLLYAGQDMEASGDYVMLVIVDGHFEFRFDCGSGPSAIRSHEAVLLHQWNKAVVSRHRWDAWIQLNNGERVQGRSRGLFSRMTLKENLYLGGVANLSSIQSSKVSTHQGLEGCVRYLEINGHTYDFRPTPKGDAVAGRALDECSAEVCNNVDCKNGGKCIANSADSALCLCPLGFGGDYCETVVDLVMPYFNGTSYLKYPGLGSSVLSFVELWVTFKPVDADGVFFYNGGFGTDGTPSDGDFVSLSLVGSFVEFRFDLGTGPAVLRSPEQVSLHEWHTVFVSRTGRDGILEIDSQPRVEGMARGAFTQLSLPRNLYVGGVPSFDHVSPELGVHASFRGCIQKIHINDKPLKLFEAALVGVNVENCNHPCVNRPCLNHGLCSPRNEYFSCHCLLGYADARCQTEIKDNITSPMFVGNSFLRYTRPEILRRIMGDGFDVRLRFRTLSSDGLLLWTGRREMTSTSSDFVAVALQAGHVHVRYNLGSGEVIIGVNGTRVDDGDWHTIRAIRTNKEGSLSVDDGPVMTMDSPGFLTQVNTDTGLYLGGVPNVLQLTVGKYSSGFMGCVSEFRLDGDYVVHLVSHAQGGINVEACV